MPGKTPEHWTAPEGGNNHVAIKATTYEARQQEVDDFFGRPLSKYSHDLTFEHVSYAIFSFKLKEEAVEFMKAFGGEPFDPATRDAVASGCSGTKGERQRASGALMMSDELVPVAGLRMNRIESRRDPEQAYPGTNPIVQSKKTTVLLLTS